MADLADRPRLREHPADGREDLESSGARVGWGGSFDDSLQGVRAASRCDGDPDARDHLIGFRVVISRSRS